MRKTIAVLVTASPLLLGLAAAGPALAGTKPPPAIHLLCSASANGGTLVNGVCVLPGGVAGGGNSYYGIIAVSNPNAGDTFKVISGTVPPGLTVPAQYGSGTIITGTPTRTGTFVFTLRATSPHGATASLAYSITITAQPPDRLVCDAGNGGTLVNGVCVLPAASVGQAYEGFIITSNNSGGTFSISSGSLPPGLSMPSVYGASGTIVAGTPTKQGTFAFTVKGTDQQGQPLQQAYSITVGQAPPLAIVLPGDGATLSSGQVGVAYAQNFYLNGGVAPYTWSVGSGQLPPGLALTTTAGTSDANNQLKGTPTTAGTFVFTMKLTDSSGQQATQQFSLTIKP